MLTGITEVDLGIDTRLKNIEETERAKRQLHEQHQSSTSSTYNDNDYQPLSRFSNQYMRNLHNDSQRQKATDDLAVERFKKRLRH